MNILKNLKIVVCNEIIENGYIKFTDKIIEIGTNSLEGIDMGGKYLFPGFIDIHTHGANGYDFMDKDLEGIGVIASELPKEGTTSFFGTTMTESILSIKEALGVIDKFRSEQNLSAELIGIHLEGPFISTKFKGAQRKDAIQDISIELFKEFQESANNFIKQVTLAPELENAMLLIDYLTKCKVVTSIGHTNTSNKQAEEAIKHGANCFTHLFNAMSPLHHRDFGAVGTALLHDEVYTEFICDRVHTNDDTIKLLYKVRPIDKIILITDSMRAKNLKQGIYSLGGQTAIVNKNSARLKDGTLAGSILRMDQAMRNFHKVTNCSIQELVKVTSTNAAKLHNLKTKGIIRKGYDADFVIINSDLKIIETYCKGNRCKY